jgi:glycerol-3-phosphate dehydrogenase
MQRDLQRLSADHFDVLIIGGGINGAWIALDAALRGLRTALVDKGDFGAATSAATGKMIHGGIRYLQHMALGRLKTSLHERMLLLRNAPHLVHPLPFLIPTSGHLLKGKEVLSLAMLIYDFFACRAVPGPPYAQIPPHQRLSRRETARLEPCLALEGLTGAVRFFDCQMPFPERLTLAVIQSAREAGATVVNYAQATKLLRDEMTVRGVRIRDQLAGDEFEIQAHCVVNATGPWADEILRAEGTSADPSASTAKQNRRFSKGIHIITRALTSGHGLALATRHQHSGAVLDRGGRHFFIVPWEGHSLVGTTNAPYEGDPDQKLVTEEDIQGLIADVNSVYPSAGLRREDVLFFYGGLYPDEPHQGAKGYQGARKDRIVDHGQGNVLHGLITVAGVKYTTGRRLAQMVVEMVFAKLQRPVLPCRTETAVLHGGDMPGMQAFLVAEQNRLAGILSVEEIDHLVRLYGTKISDVLETASENVANKTKRTADNLVMAQTRYAVRREMARKLTDVLFRRTRWGLFGHPGGDLLRHVADVMAEELAWDRPRMEQEITEVEDCYRVVT